MKELALILTLTLYSFFGNAQAVLTGTYIGDKEHGYQKLTINADSTFEYEYRDPWATLMAGYCSGTWNVENGSLVLNTDFQLDEYTVEEKWVDSLNGSYVEIENYQHEPIWEMKRIMINNDTTNVWGLGRDWTDDNSPCFSKFRKNSINYVIIFNGFFILFDYQVKKEKVNYLKITGNFSDQLWYKYFDEIEFKVQNTKLKGPEQFGTFEIKKE